MLPHFSSQNMAIQGELEMIKDIDGYIVIMRDGDIICDCMWGSLHPENFKEGKKICRHISKFINNHEKTNK